MLITRYEFLSIIALPLGVGFMLQGGVGTATPVAPDPVSARVLDVSFADDVAPILDASCIKCHGGLPDGESILEAGLDLRTYESVMKGSEFGSVVEASNVDDSLIFLMIEEGDMPEEADPLSPDDIETIKTWIAEGAKNN